MAPLGQIGKRLEIIKTAIALTDKEIITMQCSKLRLHKNDQQLNNILSVLDDENYVQATKLIDRYLHGPYDEEEDTTPEMEESTPASSTEETVETEQKKMRSREEEELIKKFGLFMEEASKEKYDPIDEDEMLLMAQKNRESTKPSEEELLTLTPAQPTPEEIIAEFDTINRDELPPSDRMKGTPPRQTESVKQKEKAAEIEEEELSFDINEIPLTGKSSTYANRGVREEESRKSATKELYKEEPHKVEETEEIEEEEPLQEEIPEEVEESIYEEASESEETPEEKAAEKPKAESIEYDPISYIDQKFRNMRNQYPQVEESSERYESVERLLYMISLEGYTERDIEKTIDHVFELKNEGKLAEASHLLLIAGATESLYAQFILARELYKGEILKKDLPEAFTQINRLALNDYPEAICDLAQFYEFGIGIDKDKKKAFSLYEDALELGVERAETHLTRMEEASRGILGKLFRR